MVVELVSFSTIITSIMDLEKRAKVFVKKLCKKLLSGCVYSDGCQLLLPFVAELTDHSRLHVWILDGRVGVLSFRRQTTRGLINKTS